MKSEDRCHCAILELIEILQEDIIPKLNDGEFEKNNLIERLHDLAFKLN